MIIVITGSWRLPNTYCGDLSSFCVLTCTVIMVSPRAKCCVQPTPTMRRPRQRNLPETQILKDKLTCVRGSEGPGTHHIFSLFWSWTVGPPNSASPNELYERTPLSPASELPPSCPSQSLTLLLTQVLKLQPGLTPASIPTAVTLTLNPKSIPVPTLMALHGSQRTPQGGIV